MTLLDRMSFSHMLGAALAAPNPDQQTRELLQQVLTTGHLTWDVTDLQLVQRLVERLDASGTDSDRLLATAQGLKRLIDEASSDEHIELLLELIADRQRVADVLQKHMGHTIRQSAFLAFVSAQRWPRELRQRVSQASQSDLIQMVRALEQCDVPLLESLLEP